MNNMRAALTYFHHLMVLEDSPFKSSNTRFGASIKRLESNVTMQKDIKTNKTMGLRQVYMGITHPFL